MRSNHARSLKSSIISLLSEAPRSLSDLKATTQMSLPTLRQALQELSDAGWVCPVGHSSSTGGRRATLFGLRGDTHLIIGVHLEIPALNMVVSALNGEIIDRTHQADQKELAPDEAVERIVAYVQKAQEAYPGRKILGIGLAMPGFMDLALGKIIFSVRAPQWQNFPLGLRLESELGLPVIIQNDVDCMAFAELANSKIPEATDMLYLGFSEGVKVSMRLGGQLIQGPFGNAGMIGRTVGSRNELQEIASVSSVCREFDQRAAALASPNETLQGISALGDRSARFRAILDAAESEPICDAVITGVIDTLAEELSKLIQILQPSLLIVGGALSHMPPGLRSRMERSIRSKLPTLINNHLLIEYAIMVGARVAAVGVVHCFLQRFEIDRP